jgi:hypothetical protein
MGVTVILIVISMVGVFMLATSLWDERYAWSSVFALFTCGSLTATLLRIAELY